MEPDYTIKVSHAEDGDQGWTVEVTENQDRDHGVIFRAERMKLDGAFGCLHAAGDAIERDLEERP